MARSGIRAVLRYVRHAPDRLLHARRRRRALERIARARPVTSVLFVCYGNICRSPYAAGAFQRQLDPALRGQIRVDSAGFFGPGRQPPQTAIEVAGRREVELSDHRSRLVLERDLVTHDIVVVMEPVQQRILARKARNAGAPLLLLLGDLDPEPIATRHIVDPIGKPAETFIEVYARIDRCVTELATAIQEPTTRSDRD